MPIPYLLDRYRILRAGGALGRGCGPLLVARPAESPPLFADFARTNGSRFPANERPHSCCCGSRSDKRRRVRADAVRSKSFRAVANGEVDAGLIIHESRFTYRDAARSPSSIWANGGKNMTLLPIPLGAILVRNDVPDTDAQSINGRSAAAWPSHARTKPR